MERQWWYKGEAKKEGPLDIDTLVALHKAKAIDDYTLVWADGMEDWQQYHSLEEFEPKKDASPPPLPSESTHDYTHLTIASPWRRYLARILDLFVLGVPIAILFGILAGSFSYEFVQWINEKSGEAIYGAIILPFVLLSEWVCFAIFGSTPGKTLFGVIPLSAGGTLLGKADYAKRLAYLWPQGLALGLPILTIFAMIVQYRRLNTGKPATYDNQLTVIRARDMNWLRGSICASVFLLTLSGMVYLNIMDLKHKSSIETGFQWRNEITGEQVHLPIGWIPETVTNEYGDLVHVFVPLEGAVIVVLASEAYEERISIENYVETWVEAVNAEMQYKLPASISTAGKHSGLSISGRMVKNPEQRVNALILQQGNRFWRILLLSQDTSEPETPAALELRQRALETIRSTEWIGI